MNHKIIMVLVMILLINKAPCQLKLNTKADLINSLFAKPDYNYLLPAFDSSICIIRQEYTLIDTAGNEFGADNKPYWGFKLGLGVITDSGIYTFKDILSPWLEDKDLDEMIKTDQRHLKPYISKRLYKRSMDKKFRTLNDNPEIGSIKNDAPKKVLVDTASATLLEADSAGVKKGKKSRDADSAALKSLHTVKPLNIGLNNKNGDGANESQTMQDDVFTSIPILDPTVSIPLQANSIDTTGWLVQISVKDGSELKDSAQLIYTVIKPSFTTVQGSLKMYVTNSVKGKGKIIGGIYFTAQFAVGKIQFYAAGLAKEDTKGWYVHCFLSKSLPIEKKAGTLKTTPILKNNKEHEN